MTKFIPNIPSIYDVKEKKSEDFSNPGFKIYNKIYNQSPKNKNITFNSSTYTLPRNKNFDKEKMLI